LDEIKQFIKKKQLNMPGDVEAHTVGGLRYRMCRVQRFSLF
jgi:hypothetical protein